MNRPSVTTNNISIGPGVLYLGVSGATPTVDVGAIGEDGIALEITSEKRDIMQGNPQLIDHSLNVKQGVKLSLNSIEWNINSLQWALGAGVTSFSAAAQTWTFGGEVAVETVALLMEHSMPSGSTMIARIWKARSDGAVSVSLGQEEHKFPYAWAAMRSTTNWAGAAIGQTEQLVQLVRQIS